MKSEFGRHAGRWFRGLFALALVFSLGQGCLGCGDPPIDTDPEGSMSDLDPMDEIDLTQVDEQPDFSGDPIDDSTGAGDDLESPAIPLPTVRDVFFGYDSDVIDAEGRAALAENARILRERDDVVVLIEGHCDERGTAQYNMALGWRRAEAVRDYLVNLNVPTSRVRTVSFGKERPFVVGTNEDSYAQNRRAHFNLSHVE